MFIDCKQIASEILDECRVKLLHAKHAPVFCDVMVGNDPVTMSYVRIKQKRAEEIGVTFMLRHLPSDITEEALIADLKEIQNTPHLAGLIIQLPLPVGIDTEQVLGVIRPELDVDALGSVQQTWFASKNKNRFIPPTAGAVLHIAENVFKQRKQSLTHMQFTVVGQGRLVGKPVTLLLQEKGYDVQVVDEHTPNAMALMQRADCLVLGAGVPGLAKPESVKPGAVVIDAGTSEDKTGQIVGDADPAVANIADLTPVPGGVGPVTVAKLMENIVSRVI